MSPIIIAAILVITTIVLSWIFVSISRKNERVRNKEFLNLLSNAGSKHGLTFSSQELLKNKIVGLDGLNQTILIIEFENDNNVICVNLAEVKSCTANKKYDSIVIGNEKKPKLEPNLRSIDLKFTFKNSSEPVSVSFYDSSLNSIYEMEALEIKVKNWEALLSRMISKELRASA